MAAIIANIVKEVLVVHRRRREAGHRAGHRSFREMAIRTPALLSAPARDVLLSILLLILNSFGAGEGRVLDDPAIILPAAVAASTPAPPADVPFEGLHRSPGEMAAPQAELAARDFGANAAAVVPPVVVAAPPGQ